MTRVHDTGTPSPTDTGTAGPISRDARQIGREGRAIHLEARARGTAVRAHVEVKR